MSVIEDAARTLIYHGRKHPGECLGDLPGGGCTRCARTWNRRYSELVKAVEATDGTFENNTWTEARYGLSHAVKLEWEE